MMDKDDLKQLARLLADEIEGRRNAPAFLDETDAAKLCGLTKRSLQEMRYQGNGPPFIKLSEGPRGPVRYARIDLNLWMNTRPRYSSTEEALADEERPPRDPKRPGSLAALISMEEHKKARKKGGR